ncbi:MAG: hypothetical protein CVU04_04535 [Bacteroidetes bacterium HGW-Bacteroidetes-20]|nr:MAG: hypothetical protein CVU04_04535 [Bacteroidetes bacterium HGW-Bacteroidetes-20]
MTNAALVSLLQNAAILLALVLLFDQITSKRRISRKIHIQIITGFVLGTLGIGIMLAAFKLEQGIIFDTRSVLLSMSAVFFGLIPTVIAIIMTALFRIVQGGAAATVGVSVIIATGSIGLIFRYFWKDKLMEITPFKFYIFGILNHIVMLALMFILPFKAAVNVVQNIGLPVMIIYPFATVLIGMLMVNRLKKEKLAISLKESEERLRLALNASQIGTYDWDMIHNKITWSEWHEMLFGYNIGEFNGSLNFFIDRVHPDDVEKVNKKLKDSLENKQFFQDEFRIIWPDQSIHWILSVGEYDFNEYGKAVRMRGTVSEITARKTIENSLIESENRFRTLLDKAPEGIFVQVEGVLVFVNSALMNLLEAKSEKDLIGTSMMDVIAPQFHNSVFKRIESQNKTGNASPLMEQEYITLKGKRISVETTASPIKYEGKNAHVVFVRDITQRKIDEEQIRKLSAAVDQSPVSIVITDLNGSIEYFNPKFTELTGYNLNETKGKTPNVLKSGFTSDEEYKILWDTIKSGNVWKGEFKNVKKDGTIYWESAFISPVRNFYGEISHYIAVKEDISEKKQILHELIDAKNKAEEANVLKSHFLTNMSHEIRTPMNGILGFLELLKDVDLTSNEREEYIDIINKSGLRLLDTINDIIEMSRIESGNLNKDEQNVNVKEILEDLYMFFKPQTDQKGVLLIPAFQNQIQKLQLITDRIKFESILTNLIKNAIKFTDKGFIELGVHTHSDSVVFYVKDTGRGIPKDRQDAIFERFIQADLKNTRGHEGSGLGLSISKAYVQLLDGKIWVESLEGQGTTFFFSLPYDFIEEDNITHNNPSDSLQLDDSHIHVLVVEDEEDNFQYLNIVLTKMGIFVERVINGKDAIKRMKQKNNFSFVLMDIKLPDISGIEATQEIRKFNTQTPIIAQSAYLVSGYKDSYLNDGFNDYLMKPIKKESIQSIVSKYVIPKT